MFFFKNSQSSLFEIFKFIDDITDLTSSVEAKLEEESELNDNDFNYNSLIFPLGSSFFNGKTAFLLFFNIEDDIRPESDINILQIKKDYDLNKEIALYLNGLLHNDKIFNNDIKTSFSLKYLKESIINRLSEYKESFLSKRKELQESNPDFDIENYKESYFVILSKCNLAVEISVHDADLIISNDYNLNDDLFELGVKIKRIFIEIRTIESESIEKIKLSKLLSENKAMSNVEYKDLYSIENQSHNHKVYKQSYNSQSSNNYTMFINDFYGNTCNLFVFNTFSNLFILNNSILTTDMLISSIEDISSKGIDVDYYYQSLKLAVNYSLSLSLIKLVFEINDKNDLNLLLKDLSIDEQVSFKDQSINYYKLKSGSVIQIKANIVSLCYNETKASYNRKILSDTINEVVPFYIRNLPLSNLNQKSSFIAFLFQPNKASQVTSFIKFYRMNFQTIGILPIKFDQSFFLTKIGGMFDPRRNYEFTVFLNNTIQYTLDTIFTDSNVTCLDYENYIKYI